MNAITITLCLGLVGTAVQADPVDAVMAAVNDSFASMPTLQRVATISGRCGADMRVNTQVAYCTSNNRVYMARDVATQPEAPYLLAHVMGHAAQVRHGVADVALRTIRANRANEAALRADVTRQVECLAGFYYHKAQLAPADLTEWFTQEPFADPHWGRNPLVVGPVVSIGLAERSEWFVRGQSGDLAACATENFGADILIGAFRGD